MVSAGELMRRDIAGPAAKRKSPAGIPPGSKGAARPRTSGVHGIEEIAVRLRLAQFVEKELDGVDGAHRVQDAAQDIHLLEDVRRNEQLLLAGARARNVQ